VDTDGYSGITDVRRLGVMKKNRTVICKAYFIGCETNEDEDAKRSVLLLLLILA